MNDRTRAIAHARAICREEEQLAAERNANATNSWARSRMDEAARTAGWIEERIGREIPDEVESVDLANELTDLISLATTARNQHGCPPTCGCTDCDLRSELMFLRRRLFPEAVL